MSTGLARSFAMRAEARRQLRGPRVHPVDRFTAAHAALGFTLGIWGTPWWVALLSTLGFELIEDGLKRVTPGLFPVGAPDPWLNSFFDSAAWMAGWGLAQAFPQEPKAPIWRG